MLSSHRQAMNKSVADTSFSLTLIGLVIHSLPFQVMHRLKLGMTYAPFSSFPSVMSQVGFHSCHETVKLDAEVSTQDHSPYSKTGSRKMCLWKNFPERVFHWDTCMYSNSLVIVKLGTFLNAPKSQSVMLTKSCKEIHAPGFIKIYQFVLDESINCEASVLSPK